MNEDMFNTFTLISIIFTILMGLSIADLLTLEFIVTGLGFSIFTMILSLFSED